MRRIIIFGAGNIGRSFLAPVFQEAGYGVTLVDIDADLVAALNEHKKYTIVVRDARGDREKTVTGYDAVPLSEREQVCDLVTGADLVATAVGQRGLPGACDLIARALRIRHKRDGVRPLDVVLAENFRNGKAFCRSRIAHELGGDVELDAVLGIVETSIGKMVPFVSDEQRAADPLRLYAEPYNTLIMDRDAFRGALPAGADIKLVSPIEAYVDRKLFVHNLGHASAAYHGRARLPGSRHVWEVLADSEIAALTEGAMVQGAGVVQAEYPGVFTAEELRSHIVDLLERFQNRSLGDTVQRVGRDLRRKLSRDDRIAGAMRLAVRHQLPFDRIVLVYLAALRFGKHPESTDEDRGAVSDVRAGIRDTYTTVSAAGGMLDELDEGVIQALERAAAGS